jgi:peroxiredoxin
MKHSISPVVWLLFAPIVAVASDAGLKEPIPSYQEAREAFKTEMAKSGGSKFREQVEKDGYAFEILSDLDDRVMKEYGLYFEVPSDLSEVYKQRLSLDLAEYNGEGRYVLTVPATFVIDRDGLITAAYADVDYRRRVEPSTIVAALQPLPPARVQRP